MLLVLLLMAGLADSERLQIVVYPLESKSQSEVGNWISFALPEFIGRKGLTLEGIKIWDPVFLFHQDTSTLKGNTDSSVNEHRNRWQWDVAFGGSFIESQDSVSVVLEIIQASGKDDLKRVELRQSGDLQNLEGILAGLLFKSFALLKIPLSPDDSIEINTPLKVNAAAYQTYIAGFGMEMLGNYNGAITAYHRAFELDEHFDRVLCRLGNLYLHSEKFQQAQKLFNVLSSRLEDPLTSADIVNYYIESGQIKQAKSFVESHRKLLEKSAWGLKSIGKMYLADGEYQRAISVLMKAVATGATDLDVELDLGMAYLSIADYDRATELFNRLIKFRPEYPRFYCCLGAAHRKAGRLMESCRVLETALKKDPVNATILNELATTFIELKWYDRAIQLLIQALENSPQLHDIYVNLAVAYWYTGKKSEAYQWLGKAKQFTYLRQSVYINYGNMFYSEGKKHTAVKMYKKAIKNGKKNLSVYQNLAQIYESSGKLNKSHLYYKECLALSPNHTGLLLKMAIISEKMQQYSEAENCYQKILDISPYQKTAINGFALLLIKEGKLEEAVKPVENYLMYIPSDKVFMLLVADIYRKMQWYEVAILRYQAVIRDFPEDSEGYLGAGQSIIQMIQNKASGNYEDAIYVLKQAAVLNPNDGRADILIGDIYMQYKGYRELAVDHWEKALLRINDPREKDKLKEKIKNAGMR
ncbi:MAG TPA: tetratricopeptide repeat protein [Chitinispirillaceae bacterium]|nr:tetratricopeptide repeat protein [Chitinispirillaceae bacterium]